MVKMDYWRVMWRRAMMRRKRRIAMGIMIKIITMKTKARMKIKLREDLKQMKARKHMRPVAKMHRREASMAAGSNLAVFLPLDIMANILSRLPVKSLVRFRCICKQWCSLTYNPVFINEQRTRALGRPALISQLYYSHNPQLDYSHKFFRYDFGDDGELKDCSFYKKLGEWVNCALSNPVNGLVCGFYDNRSDGRHYLLNPSTQELVELPRSSSCQFSRLGFAFDVSSEVYKLVRLFSREGNRNCCGCEVLTVGTTQWRYVEDFPCKIPVSRPVLLNGALHWIVWKFHHSDAANARPTILIFDVKDEMFRMMPVPKSPRRFSIPLVSLTDWGGHLCFVEHPKFTNPFFRFWVLRDYKSQKWLEEYKIDMSRFITKFGGPRFIGIRDHQILFIWFHDEHTALHIVHQLKSRTIYSYNLYTRAIQELYCGAFHALEFFSESLIAPRHLAGNLSLQ